jgi:hypothetical protein
MARRTSAELEKLVEQVDAWRAKEGGRRARIPEEMWQEAVRAARGVGVWAAAKALRFNYQALRGRVELENSGGERTPRTASGGRGLVAKTSGRSKTAMAGGAGRASTAGRVRRSSGRSAKEKAGPEFIALEMGQLGGVRRTVIDLESRHGDRMRFEVAGGVDIVGLMQRLCSGQP